MRLILSRKILPVTATPITDGAVCIVNGKIVDIGPRSILIKKYAGAHVTDLGDSLLMPGLVNAHTHIELSHLQGNLGEPDGFFEWISALIEARRSIGSKGLAVAAAKAVRYAVSTGTTCLGDISATELAVPSITRSGVRSVVFLEILGLDHKDAVRSLNLLLERIDRLDALPARINAGVSPHSTYSVSDKHYSMLRDIISDTGLYSAVHLSETIDETRHIRGGKSLLDGYHAAVGWESHKKNRASSPLDFVIGKGLADRLLAVHAVHVSSSDIRRMAAAGISVAHCPRSNHLLGVGTAPVRKMMEKGVNVALGTDSLASNMDIDLWEEMRFAYLVNRLKARDIIEMATINGARALGLGGVTGSIEPGKAADLIAVKGPASKARDPYLPLLRETRPDSILMSMVDGKTIYRSKEI